MANSLQIPTWTPLIYFTACLLQQRFERSELLHTKKLSSERGTGLPFPCFQEDSPKQVYTQFTQRCILQEQSLETL